MVIKVITCDQLVELEKFNKRVFDFYRNCAYESMLFYSKRPQISNISLYSIPRFLYNTFPSKRIIYTFLPLLYLYDSEYTILFIIIFGSWVGT